MNTFLYVLTITCGFALFTTLIYLHLKWVKKSRSNAPYKKFSLTVILGSLFVPIMGVLSVFISGYIATNMRNAATGSQEHFSEHPLSIALILLLPMMILVYAITVWKIDKKYKLELQAIIPPKVIEKNNTIKKQTKITQPGKSLFDFQPERTDRYQVRKNLFEAVKTYQLTETGLIVTEKEKEIRNIPFKDMTQIRLYFEPARYASSNYACKITYRSGNYIFNSTNFNGVANFSNFRERYTPFVKTLVTDAIKNNHSVDIRAGIKSSKYRFYQILIFGTIGLILATFLIFPIPLGGITIILRLIFVIYLVYYSVKILIHNKPRKIEREDELNKVLP